MCHDDAFDLQPADDHADHGTAEDQETSDEYRGATDDLKIRLVIIYKNDRYNKAIPIIFFVQNVKCKINTSDVLNEV